jgi:hypothetical protein
LCVEIDNLKPHILNHSQAVISTASNRSLVQWYGREVSLFELNTQEVVEMLRGQKMPSPVASLAFIIAIMFIEKRQLPMDWIKKTF